jgi:hypothetical protein
MDLMILKKKIDGYRVANGSIKNVPPELLLELRQTWENFIGDQDQFRAELGIKTGTLRNLLVESKKLNHVLASAGAMELVAAQTENGAGLEPGLEHPQSEGKSELNGALELVFDHGSKVIRFPSVDSLVEFLRKSA